MIVEPHENLSRYLFSKNNFSQAKHIVRYTAFMPPPDKRLSVFRTLDLPEATVWAIGDDVGRQRNKTLLGRGDIKAVAVHEVGLAIDPNDVPPRHANIIGWPDDDSAIKLTAIELAQRAELSLK
jgi:hypothetical protein